MAAVPSAQTGFLEDRRDLVVGFSASVLVHLVGALVWLMMSYAVLNLQRSIVKDLEAGLNRMDPSSPDAKEPPLLFIEVAPEQAAEQPPEQAKYYSAVSSQAANPDAALDSNLPKIAGSQELIPKTVDTARVNPDMLQPSPPPTPESVLQQPNQPTEPSTSPTAEPNVNEPLETAAVKPVPLPTETKPRPRRLIDAKPQASVLVGAKMKQEGGVRRRGTVALDVKATPFGAYDAAIIAAIQKRWYDLLDESRLSQRAGKVVITFRLHSDGRITNLQVLEEDVGEVLVVFCRRAITDPAPYASWPAEMRRIVGRDYRDLRFTFFYL